MKKETEVLQTRISKELKEQAKIVLNSIGMTTTDAVRIFLQQCVNSGGLPFQPKMRVNHNFIKSAANRLANKAKETGFTEEELSEYLREEGQDPKAYI